MNKNSLRYFSHNFELDISKLPTKSSDRMALKIALPGIVFGLLLMIIGICEFLFRDFSIKTTSEMSAPQEPVIYESFMNPTFFDITIALIGAWIVFSLFASYIRYRKIKFDGKVFEVTDRPFIGDKKTRKEKIADFAGVMFRIEFFQFGFINRNRYIIELWHKNSQKNVPLYISTNDKNVRSKWEALAKKLKMPALILTDDGLVSKDPKDLGKTLRQLANEGKVKSKFNIKSACPKAVAYTKKSDKTVIKVRKVLWDIYNLIGWAGILIFGGMLAIFFAQHDFSLERTEDQMLSTFYVAATLGLFFSIFVLFRKDKIVIKKYKIVIVHKFMLFSRKKDEIEKNKIESIEINFNPATSRYFLSIISKDKYIVAAKKLPIKSLKWVRDFLISEIVK